MPLVLLASLVGAAPLLDDAHARVQVAEVRAGAPLLAAGDVPAVLLFPPGCGPARAVYLAASPAPAVSLTGACRLTRVDLKDVGPVSPARVAERRPATDPLDAVAAAPASHRVLLENGVVRVLEVAVPPATREPFHGHAWPSVFIADVQTHFRMFVPDRDAPVADRPERRGTWAASFEPEEVHAVENVDPSRSFHAVRIEVKPAR